MPNRPNILFVIADDHAPWALGCGGNRQVRTPALDELAAAGVCVENAYILGGRCPAVCIPTRAALHTGVAPSRACVDAGKPRDIRAEAPLLFETLRHAGYHTHGIGKWHNCEDSYRRSFESGARIHLPGMGDQFRLPMVAFNPAGEYPMSAHEPVEGFSTDLFCDAAVDFLDQRCDERPFALYVALTSPHDPRTAPARYHAMYPPEEIELPPNCVPEHPFDNGELAIRDEKLAATPRDPAEIRRHVADYYAMITSTDDAVQRLVGRLREISELENTIIVYTSDHGLAVGQHGLMGKQNVYDHSVKVPLLMRGPGIPAGRRIEAPIQSYDLHPTLCELVGVPFGDAVEARSFRRCLEGGAATRSPVGSSHRSQFAIRGDGFKLNCYFDPATGAEEVGKRQLFDVTRDPWETENLAALPQHAKRLARLEQEMAEWRKRTGMTKL